MENKFLTMDNRICLEKQDKRNDQLIELILDRCVASRITGLTEDFKSLEFLSIIAVGLETLDGFPKLPNLIKLDLCDNKLTGGLDVLVGCPKLKYSDLSGNNIEDFDVLEPLKHFQSLTNLYLYNNAIAKVNDYKNRVFNLLPNLHCLDGCDRTGEQIFETDNQSTGKKSKGENDYEVGEMDEHEDKAGEYEDDDGLAGASD